MHVYNFVEQLPDVLQDSEDISKATSTGNFFSWYYVCWWHFVLYLWTLPSEGNLCQRFKENDNCLWLGLFYELCACVCVLPCKTRSVSVCCYLLSIETKQIDWHKCKDDNSTCYYLFEAEYLIWYARPYFFKFCVTMVEKGLFIYHKLHTISSSFFYNIEDNNSNSYLFFCRHMSRYLFSLMPLYPKPLKDQEFILSCTCS